MFYLGTHQTGWLAQTDTPLFVSNRRLMRLRQLPRARGRWALDSGGFSEISLYGEWRTAPADYTAAVQRYATEIGGLDWAAIQDWMCEPVMLRRTGLSVRLHQERTIRSYLELMSRAPHLPWAPVLQGWLLADYLRHVEMYQRAGVCLAGLPRVGLGSVCRRQATGDAEVIVDELASLGIALHGFGFKLQGLARVSGKLASSDSMAWSYDARRSPPLPGHTHKNCANCREFAQTWYSSKVLPLLSSMQLRLF